jgi:hypothetical protein
MIYTATDDMLKLAALVASMKKYQLLIEVDQSDGSVSYKASNENHAFYADDLVSLLGLIVLGETRGDDWRLSEDEVSYVELIEDRLYQQHEVT